MTVLSDNARLRILQALNAAHLGRPARAAAYMLRHGRRYRATGIEGFNEIPGWLTTAEAMALHRLAAGAPGERPVVVEIGSWLGKSSLVLARGLKSRPEGVLYCIDPFNGDGEEYARGLYGGLMSTMERSLQEQFLDNMRRHRVENSIRVMAGYSTDFAAGFDEPIDVLFIDGNHDYEAVRQDCVDWAVKVKPGGIVAFHDVVFDDREDPPGPTRVVREEIVDSHGWTDVRLVDSLLVARKVDQAQS